MKDIEKVEVRCPKLGGPVPLSYCLKESGNLPCRHILRCFSGIREKVMEILSSMYSQDELKKAFSLQEDPYSRILKKIKAARESTKA